MIATEKRPPKSSARSSTAARFVKGNSHSADMARLDALQVAYLRSKTIAKEVFFFISWFCTPPCPQLTIGHGEVRVYRGTGVSRGVRQTTWETDPSKIGSSKSLVLKSFSGEGTLWDSSLPVSLILWDTPALFTPPLPLLQLIRGISWYWLHMSDPELVRKILSTVMLDSCSKSENPLQRP